MPEIIVCIKDREIARFPVMKTWTTIGRDDDNDMAIDNESVSRFHATLSYSGGTGFVIEDRGSSNGITVNGGPTSCTTIKPGDRIGIGKYTLTFSNTGGVPVDELVFAEPPKEETDSLHRRTYMMSADVVKQYQKEWEASGGMPQQGGASQPGARPQPVAMEASSNAGLVVAIVLVALVLVGLIVWLIVS